MIKTVKVKCHGRTLIGEPALIESVEATVMLGRAADSGLCSCNVACPYNTGGHGQRCKASHPWTDKDGEGVACPFSFDYPYVLASIGWKVPEELREALEAVMLGKE